MTVQQCNCYETVTLQSLKQMKHSEVILTNKNILLKIIQTIHNFFLLSSFVEEKPIQMVVCPIGEISFLN